MAFSAGVVSAYLALDLRLIEGVPVGRQFEASRGAELLPVMLMGGIAIGICVAVQYYVLFRSPLRVLGCTGVLWICAWWLTGKSLQAFVANMRYQLGRDASGPGEMYVEV